MAVYSLCVRSQSSAIRNIMPQISTFVKENFFLRVIFSKAQRNKTKNSQNIRHFCGLSS